MGLDRVDLTFEADILSKEGDALRRRDPDMGSDDLLIDGDAAPEDFRAQTPATSANQGVRLRFPGGSSVWRAHGEDQPQAIDEEE